MVAPKRSPVVARASGRSPAGRGDGAARGVSFLSFFCADGRSSTCGSDARGVPGLHRAGLSLAAAQALFSLDLWASWPGAPPVRKGSRARSKRLGTEAAPAMLNESYALPTRTWS